MNTQIVPLPREKWKGAVVPIRYTTDAYYDLELTESEGAFQARMVKKQFDAPVTHSPCFWHPGLSSFEGKKRITISMTKSSHIAVSATG